MVGNSQAADLHQTEQYSLPNPLSALPGLITANPVTHTALVAMNRASMKAMATCGNGQSQQRTADKNGGGEAEDQQAGRMAKQADQEMGTRQSYAWMGLITV